MQSVKLYSEILGLIRRVRPVIETIGVHDSDLARQARRALTSIALNTAEGAKMNDGNARARFKTAMGSANEERACLETAEAMGYLEAVDARMIDDLDRIARTLNRLARPRR